MIQAIIYNSNSINCWRSHFPVYINSKSLRSVITCLSNSNLPAYQVSSMYVGIMPSGSARRKQTFIMWPWGMGGNFDSLQEHQRSYKTRGVQSINPFILAEQQMELWSSRCCFLFGLTFNLLLRYHSRRFSKSRLSFCKHKHVYFRLSFIIYSWSVEMLYNGLSVVSACFYRRLPYSSWCYISRVDSLDLPSDCYY